MSKTEKFNDILKSKFDNWRSPVDEANWKDMRNMIDNSRKDNKRRWLIAAIFLIGLMAAGGVYRSLSGVEMNSKTTSVNSSVNKPDNATNQVVLPQTPKIALNNTAQSLAIRQGLPLAVKQSSNSRIVNQPVSHSNEVVTVVSSNTSAEIQNPVNNEAPTNNSLADNQTLASSTSATTAKFADAPEEAKKDNTTASPDSIGINNGIPDKLSAGSVGKKNIFSLELGIGLSGGWNYGNTVEGHGMNPLIGVGFTHKINPKWAVKTGLQLSGFTDMNETPYTVSHVNYDFGYNAVDTTITTNWLYYATIPLQVEYTIDRDNAIGGGGSLSYLIAQYGNVVAYTESLTNGTNITHQGKQFADLQGYNKYNSSVYVFYKRHLFKKFSGYFNIYYGLSDIKNNNFFMQNKFERDYGVKFVFSYSIF